MKPIGWIYLTTNLVNGKIYVGKHEILENKKLNATYIGSGTYFKRALKKYGEENFKRKILRLCYTLHELRIWEHVYIVKYKSYVRSIGYNIAKGDVNTSEYNPAKLPEVRKKMSKSAKARCSTEEYRKLASERSESVKKRMSITRMGSNNPMYGTRYLWINNGVKNKRHNIGEEIPDGWEIGFIMH